MDFIVQIFLRVLDQQGPIIIAAPIAIVLLIGLVVFMRRRKNAPARKAAPKPKAQAAEIPEAEMPEIDAIADLDAPEKEITLNMSDETPTAQQAPDMASQMDAQMPAQMDGKIPDQLDDSLAHQFDIDTGAMENADMDELDDITIPRVGEAPPARKSRFFSASWLHRDDDAADMAAGNEFETKKITAKDKKHHAEAAEHARLAEIERNMLALRELYEAGLIAPEVYALKAREFAAQVH